MTFGIFAEAVSGPIAIDADELAPPPVSLGADRRAFIRGVTRAMVAILDLEALARDPRIQVNDETE
jgi:chemotaxis signal transduction protein